MDPLHVFSIILYNIGLYIYTVRYKFGIKNTWFSPEPFKKNSTISKTFKKNI